MQSLWWNFLSLEGENQISLQISNYKRVGTSLRSSFVRVFYIISNQGSYRSSQYNLPDRMLWLDANATWIKVKYYSFFRLIWHITKHKNRQILSSNHENEKQGLVVVVHGEVSRKRRTECERQQNKIENRNFTVLARKLFHYIHGVLNAVMISRSA